MVSQTLGHSNISTTADTYAHVTPAMQERSAARMDQILAGRNVGTAENQEALLPSGRGLFTFKLGGEPGRT